MASEPSFEERVHRAVLARLPGASRVTSVTRLAGGASKESWGIDAVVDDRPARLVLRRARSASAGPGLSTAIEARLHESARSAGLPVPRVRALLEKEDNLGHGFFMDRIEGETIPRKILRDETLRTARASMARQCGMLLGSLHQIDRDALPDLPVQQPLQQLDTLMTAYDSFDMPRPVLEAAFVWLGDHAPPPGDPVLVHGDFRNGNFVVDRSGIVSVLDWELAHLGNGLEDLGWLCVASWRFGELDKPVGGFGKREDLFAAYAESRGASVDADAVRYWEVFGTLRWGVICLMQAFAHLSGAHRSVELAAIGRRVSETEIDLLELLT